MSSPTPRLPLLYQESFDVAEEDEAQTIEALIETLAKIAQTTHADSGKAIRSVHAKSHGLLYGELEIPADLAEEYRQGLFAEAGTYPVVLRLSTSPGDLLPDNVSTPRGLAIKVLDVVGKRLDGSEQDTTQDFLLVNGPVFNAVSAKQFLKSLKPLAATTDKAERSKQALSAIFRGAERALEAVGGESATLKSMGGHPQTHILGETFYTQVPLQFGAYMAKLSVVPIAPGLLALKDQPVEMKGRPDALREEVSRYLRTQPAVWEVRAQLCTDLETMPIDDATQRWPEEQSPYVTVARLTALPQSSWDEEKVATIDEGLSFSPWHGLAAHRPLGSIMRVRRAVYAALANLRGTQAGRSLAEPVSAESLGNPS